MRSKGDAKGERTGYGKEQIVKLTLPVRPARQDGHGARLEHLFVQVRLLELAQLLVQLSLVDGLARLRPVRDRAADLVRQGFLLGQVFPVCGSAVATVGLSA